MVSELGHLSGAFWGLAVGLAMLKLGWVDCEGWDVFSLLKKRRELAKNWKKRGEQLDRRKKADRMVHRRMVAAEADDPDERAASALEKVRKLIDMGDHASAISEYDRAAGLPRLARGRPSFSPSSRPCTRPGPRRIPCR